MPKDFIPMKRGTMLLGFFNAIDTPGGHIFICVGLIMIYALCKNTLTHDIVVFALGVLSRSMGTKKGADEYAPLPGTLSKTTDTTTTTQASTDVPNDTQ